MAAENDTQEEVPGLSIALPSGAVIYGGIVVGKMTREPGTDPFADEARLTLDLGWCKAAGLHLTVRGDPEVDHKRGGVVLER